MKTRWLVHGDLSEDGTTYFCQKCDEMVDRSHNFERVHGPNEYKFYLASLKNWRAIQKTDPDGWFRADDARSVVA
ncbi:MAG: hypothetical protein ACRYFR_14270 [Janthinobacterium lividum]